MLAVLACSILLLAPPESDVGTACLTCTGVGPGGLVRFYLRGIASDLDGNVSEPSVRAAEVTFDIADIACWRRMLAGLTCLKEIPLALAPPPQWHRAPPGSQPGTPARAGASTQAR